MQSPSPGLECVGSAWRAAADQLTADGKRAHASTRDGAITDHMMATPEAPDTVRILIANEPRAYREAITAALRALRPHAEVILVEPDRLDGAVLRLAPDLVVCSRLTEAVRACPLAWVLLYPNGKSQAVISFAGQLTTVAGIDFEGLLALVDRTERLAV